MKKLWTLLTRFAAHWQGTQGLHTKANLAKELQTYAATSCSITINFIANFIKTKIQTPSPPTTLCNQIHTHILFSYNIIQLLLESDNSPPKSILYSTNTNNYLGNYFTNQLFQIKIN